MRYSRSLSIYTIALAAVLLMGAIFYFTGYDYGLPLYENMDEKRNLYEVYIQRGLSDWSLTKPGYPPGILWVYYGAQYLTELLSGQSAYAVPDHVIVMVRVFSITASLCSAYFLSRIARKLSGDVAAIVAPAIWLVSPLVLERTSDGLPQAYEMLLNALAFYLALLVLERRRPLWAYISVGFGLGAVLFKYVDFPTLGFGVGAALWNVQHDRKTWLRVLGIQMVAIAVCAVAVYTLNNVEALIGINHMETTAFLQSGPERLFAFGWGVKLLEMGAAQIGLPLLVMVGILIVGSGVYLLRHKANWQRVGWIFLLGMVVIHFWLTMTYVVGLDGSQRYTAPVSGFLVVLVVIAVLEIAQKLGEWSSNLRLPDQWVTGVSAGAFLLVWFGLQFVGGIAWGQARALPTTQGSLLAWAGVTLPENREALLVSDTATPFDIFWIGHKAPSRPWVEGDLMARTLDEWRADYVIYAQLTPTQIQEMEQTPAGQAYLDDMLLLKQFPPPDEVGQWRGFRNNEAEMGIYLLDRMQQEVAVPFGDAIQLIGYDLNTVEGQPGDTLRLMFYWQAVTPPTGDYSLFLHLVPQDSTEVLNQVDAPPAWEGRRPTSTWTDPLEVLIGGPFDLTLPDDILPGDYRLLMGLYDSATGQRLHTENDLDYFPLTSIAVTD